DQRHALLAPGLVALHDPRSYKIKDRRLHRVDRSEHPPDRARPRIGVIGEKARISFAYMEHDGPSLEQGEIAFLIGRNLPKRMKRKMRRFFHRTERNKANFVGLPHFLQRPAHARIARQSLAAI